MNYSIIRYIIGWVFNLLAVLMLLPCIVAVIYKEKSGFAFVITLLVSLIIGILCTFRKPKNTVFYTKEGFVAVALSWILMSIVGAMPFVISGEIPGIEDALFETASGFTTTGATILLDVESLSYCMLFWRSFTHWIGGMGVLVFILALMPAAGGYNMHIMRAESPGHSVGKLVPKVRQTAMILYGIYIFLSILQLIFLLAGGMSLFDATTTMFATAGTGGFGIKNDGMMSYSSYIQNVVTVFMALFGINFNVYFFLLIRKPLQALKVEELRYYIGVILASTALIAINIRDMYSGWGEAVKHSAFQVSSIITTTGFATTDFELWPQFSKTILLILMFVGACSGSTGGGVKFSRVIILLKSLKKEFELLIHSRGVKKVHFDGRPIEAEVVRTINAYVVAYVMLFVGSFLIISLDNFSIGTNVSAIAATLNNVGPGFEAVGPTQNFGIYSPLSKVVMTFDMIAGRLELFPILMLFRASTWKKN